MNRLILIIGTIITLATVVAKSQVEVQPDAFHAHGEIHISSAVATPTTSGTPVKMNGTTTADTLKYFDMPANNRLRYVGPKTIIAACHASTSMSTSAGSIRGIIMFAVGGAVDTTSVIDRTFSNPNDHGAQSTSFIHEFSNGDYVELWLDSSASNPTFTVDHYAFQCFSVGD